MTAYKGAEFWMRVTLAVLAGALFLTVHAVYWPVVISLILTFILMPIRDGVIKGLRRLTGRQVPIDIAILISFVILIVIVRSLPTASSNRWSSRSIYWQPTSTIWSARRRLW